MRANNSEAKNEACHLYTVLLSILLISVLLGGVYEYSPEEKIEKRRRKEPQRSRRQDSHEREANSPLVGWRLAEGFSDLLLP